MATIFQFQRRGSVIIYFLVIVILLVLVTILCLLLWQNNRSDITTKQLTNRNQYAWQNTCDSRCANALGKSGMEEIDGYGCEMLSGIVEYSNSYTGIDRNRLAAMEDKLASIHCYDFAWLKTCDKACVKNLGWISLSLLDAQNNCPDLIKAGKEGQNFQTKHENVTELVRALNDRLSFLSCHYTFSLQK